MPLSPVEVHATLDTRGLLDAAHGAGCYSLRLSVPDEPEARWQELFDAVPDGFDRIADAKAVAYAGASKDVYGRIMDHVKAKKRRAALLRAFPPDDVVDVTPFENPFEQEWGYARRVSRWGFTCWCDGELL